MLTIPADVKRIENAFQALGFSGAGAQISSNRVFELRVHFVAACAGRSNFVEAGAGIVHFRLGPLDKATVFIIDGRRIKWRHHKPCRDAVLMPERLFGVLAKFFAGHEVEILTVAAPGYRNTAADCQQENAEERRGSVSRARRASGQGRAPGAIIETIPGGCTHFILNVSCS
ncbi:MAG: hypothetical protein KGY48_08595 [Wenzhouxiangellaceae bacterium]|nr:hypothetical protein [Wenzhouxiangellaceae bacterium]MBS3747026.1 hypothetical protein [Wenzhouxiangellaceae bacterium]MBS3824223.1 hypothetical protein [Wenzhouxiangellaceae bacterium]